MPEAKNVSVCW